MGVGDGLIRKGANRVHIKQKSAIVAREAANSVSASGARWTVSIADGTLVDVVAHKAAFSVIAEQTRSAATIADGTLIDILTQITTGVGNTFVS